MAKYQYKPLLDSPEAIRVLRVHKQATEHSLIECSLHDASIPTTKYIALSYVWGTDLPTYKILLDGAEYFVRPNLWFCLHYAQQNLSGKNLWVDNLCINQADEQEKNIQVALMGRIYTQAVQVRSWLNDRRCIFTTAEGYASGASLLSVAITDRTLRDLDPPEALKLLPAMARLVTHEYWSRAWIVQELLLAKEVLLIWEGYEILWNDLIHLFEHDSTPPTTHSTFESQLSSYLQTTHDQSFEKLALFGVLNYARSGNLIRKPPLINVMLMFRYHRSSVLNDRAFAFVGLADMSGIPPLEIDYRDSATELWCRVVYAATVSPTKSEMEELAQLMEIDQSRITLPVVPYGREQAFVRQYRNKLVPRLCAHCLRALGCYIERVLILAIPGSPLAVVFHNDSPTFSSNAWSPVLIVPLQEKDADSTIVFHQKTW